MENVKSVAALKRYLKANINRYFDTKQYSFDGETEKLIFDFGPRKLVLANTVKFALKSDTALNKSYCDYPKAKDLMILENSFRINIPETNRYLVYTPI